MHQISLIVPCFNEENTIPIFYKAILEIIEKMTNVNFELLFVDDGSSDGTFSVLKSLHHENTLVNYLSFSRNFGKEAAIYAGLKQVHGDYVVIMDVDLQDPPSLIPQMYQILSEKDGYDCVATRRVTRKGEPKIRSFCARCFYKLINKISKTEIVDGARDFRMMSRRMVNAILSVKEYNRFSKGIFSWVGYKTKWLEYENIERVAGETKWSIWKLFKYSMDGIIAFSTAPLALSSFIGFLLCVVAFIMAVVYSVKTLIWGDPVSGFPTLICVILLVGGVQLFCMGILGQYLAKAYLETKDRPLYIVQESSFSADDETKQ